jgi:transcriptional regulator with XRE-family HTH domain
MRYNTKLYKVLAFTGWAQDHLADLLDISTPTINAWVNGKSEPHKKHQATIDNIYEQMVAPYVCELEQKADEIEKEILQQKIKDLAKDNTCGAE